VGARNCRDSRNRHPITQRGSLDESRKLLSMRISHRVCTIGRKGLEALTGRLSLMHKVFAAALFLCSLLFATSAFPQSHRSGTHSSRSHSSRKSSPHSAAPPRTYKKNYLAEGYSAHSSVQRDQHGRIKRNTAAKAAFERASPCPSTGKTSGSCKGYVIDHVKPLECGGADAPSNMQWQTAADGKVKDKTERSCR